MITLKNISKSYGSHKVVQDINLDINPGEIHLMVGRNGEGKSTILELMSYLYESDSGTITIDDKQISSKDYKYRSKIGYVFSSPMYIDVLNAIEYLHFVGDMYGIDRKDQWEKISYYLNLFSIPGGKRIAKLSKGMKKQLSFIAALLHEPKYLIMDEPFDGFDMVSRRLVQEFLLELKGMGIGIFIVSHHYQQLFYYSDRVSLLRNGKLLFNLTKSELIDYANALSDAPNATNLFVEASLEGKYDDLLFH